MLISQFGSINCHSCLPLNRCLGLNLADLACDCSPCQVHACSCRHACPCTDTHSHAYSFWLTDVRRNEGAGSRAKTAARQTAASHRSGNAAARAGDAATSGGGQFFFHFGCGLNILNVFWKNQKATTAEKKRKIQEARELK